MRSAEGDWPSSLRFSFLDSSKPLITPKASLPPVAPHRPLLSERALPKFLAVAPIRPQSSALGPVHAGPRTPRLWSHEQRRCDPDLLIRLYVVTRASSVVDYSHQKLINKRTHVSGGAECTALTLLLVLNLSLRQLGGVQVVFHGLDVVPVRRSAVGIGVSGHETKSSLSCPGRGKHSQNTRSRDRFPKGVSTYRMAAVDRAF